MKAKAVKQNAPSINGKRRKVVIVGAGAVGSTYAYALAQSALAEEIAILDSNQDLAEGQALDLSHGEAFFPMTSIYAGNTPDYADAGLIVITAGAAQKPGQTRLDLLQRNAAIVKEIIQDIKKQNSQAILLLVTNPVDVMTYAALQYSGWDPMRVMGSGTVLDSARLRQALSTRFAVDAHNIHSYILGEHGDSEFAAWSLAHIAGIPVEQYAADQYGRNKAQWETEKKQIEKQVRESAYHIIDYKGATNFAIGMALLKITAAIMRGQNSVLTVSTLLKGEYGLHDVCLSVPCLVSEKGIKQIVHNRLSETEQAALNTSAEALKNAIARLNLK